MTENLCENVNIANGFSSSQGSSVSSSQFLCLSPTNHVTHPGEELHPRSALQRTGDLSSRGRRFRQRRGTAADNQPAARAQRYETSAICGFPPVCGWADRQRSADIH